MKTLLSIIFSLLLLAGAAGADHQEQDRPKKERVWARGHVLRQRVWLAGTVDHEAGGQIWLKTRDNGLAQIPHMAMMYNVNPALRDANLNPGAEVRLRLPARSLRFIAKEGDRLLWESYEGSWWLPETVFQRKHHRKRSDKKD